MELLKYTTPFFTFIIMQKLGIIDKLITEQISKSHNLCDSSKIYNDQDPVYCVVNIMNENIEFIQRTKEDGTRKIIFFNYLWAPTTIIKGHNATVQEKDQLTKLSNAQKNL